MIPEQQILYNFCPFINQPCNGGIIRLVEGRQSALMGDKPILTERLAHCVFFSNRFGCRLLGRINNSAEDSENEKK